MKKGCIITIIVFAALVTIGAIFGYKLYGPKIMSGVTSTQLFAIEEAMKEYAAEFGSFPEGDHEAVVVALRGSNSKEIDFLKGKGDGAVVDGKLVDIWRHPLTMTRNPDGSLSFTSSGADGEPGTADDITSATVRDLVGKLEEKISEADAKAAE